MRPGRGRRPAPWRRRTGADGRPAVEGTGPRSCRRTPRTPLRFRVSCIPKQSETHAAHGAGTGTGAIRPLNPSPRGSGSIASDGTTLIVSARAETNRQNALEHFMVGPHCGWFPPFYPKIGSLFAKYCFPLFPHHLSPRQPRPSRRVRRERNRGYIPSIGTKDPNQG